MQQLLLVRLHSTQLRKAGIMEDENIDSDVEAASSRSDLDQVKSIGAHASIKKVLKSLSINKRRRGLQTTNIKKTDIKELRENYKSTQAFETIDRNTQIFKLLTNIRKVNDVFHKPFPQFWKYGSCDDIIDKNTQSRLSRGSGLLGRIPTSKSRYALLISK
ncbi:hypothetical protein PsorP6_000617 [Peronosclerospora sorghi]|uniref:Uncharacterized protein n=1 Tax=Peronosclerospora sorghi TaxID=230839 RepID=A0ACC0WRC8_9STRA|nr:hypothetical protein PsorP6_000617 [Peronosclerospora sorghi]